MRKSGNSSALFFVFGIALIVICVVLMIIGNGMSRENDFYVQQEYYYEHGRMDTTGNTLMYVGIGLAVLGGILIVGGLYVNHIGKRKFAVAKNSNYDDVDNMIEQMAGTTTIFDTFRSGDKTFCFYRDKTCILKSGDQVFRGKMEPLEWDAGRPTLWDISLDCGGEEKHYEVSKVERNILVKGDREEEIFCRE